MLQVQVRQLGPKAFSARFQCSPGRKEPRLFFYRRADATHALIGREPQLKLVGAESCENPVSPHEPLQSS